MIYAFIFWSLISLVFVGLGIWSWRSEKPVGFFSGIKPPAVSDVGKYNRSVAVLWFVYALLFELLGLPFLLMERHSAGFLVSVLGVPVISIGLAVVYTRILYRYEIKKERKNQHGDHSS